jgi:hypothetical protein
MLTGIPPFLIMHAIGKILCIYTTSGAKILPAAEVLDKQGETDTMKKTQETERAGSPGLPQSQRENEHDI